ncbi:YybH family protein [Kitasatospora sp. NPDC051853]|uniref:YybH family protein n=1 Tax=Kitasatospora sp. NPDC051853 TaxID=3364058 RepID=UPI00378859F2
MNTTTDLVHGNDPIPTTLTTDPELHPAAFAAAFNSGSPQVLAAVYEPGAVFVPHPGRPVSGVELLSSSAEFQSLGVPITVRLRHCYVAGELALLIVDWVIVGMGHDGAHVHIEGTATDVARRGPDGFWRYVIDNPFGAVGEGA